MIVASKFRRSDSTAHTVLVPSNIPLQWCPFSSPNFNSPNSKSPNSRVRVRDRVTVRVSVRVSVRVRVRVQGFRDTPIWNSAI